MAEYPLNWIFYLSFIFLTAFVFLNMMIGVILDVMQQEQVEYQKLIEEEQESSEMQAIEHRLQRIE